MTPYSWRLSSESDNNSTAGHAPSPGDSDGPTDVSVREVTIMAAPAVIPDQPKPEPPATALTVIGDASDSVDKPVEPVSEPPTKTTSAGASTPQGAVKPSKKLKPKPKTSPPVLDVKSIPEPKPKRDLTPRPVAPGRTRWGGVVKQVGGYLLLTNLTMVVANAAPREETRLRCGPSKAVDAH